MDFSSLFTPWTPAPAGDTFDTRFSPDDSTFAQVLRNLLMPWQPPGDAAGASQRKQQQMRQQSLSAAPVDLAPNDAGPQPTFANFGSLAPTSNNVPLPRPRPATADTNTAGLYDTAVPMPAN